MPYDQISVLILSRNEIEREGLRGIVAENGFAVAAVYRTVADLDLDLFADQSGKIPVLLVDQIMDSEGLQSVSDLRSNWPHCKIIIMSSGCDSQTVRQAFQTGADGYIGKHISCASLTEIIKLVALGEKIVPYQVVLDMPSTDPSCELTPAKPDTSGAKLSERQIDILRGLARGDPNKVISRRLAITEATVKVHVKSILRRIGVANRTQAAVWAIEAGLLNDRPEPSPTPVSADARHLPSGSAQRHGSNGAIPA